MKNNERIHYDRMMAQASDEYRGHQYYHLFKNPDVLDGGGDPQESSGGTGGLKADNETTYRNEKHIVSAFPIKRIEIRRQKEEDKQLEREKFDRQIMDIIENDKTAQQQAFTYEDGKMKLIENELILRSKLTRIDDVVQEYFKHNSNFSL